jgi:hypothetical protein
LTEYGSLDGVVGNADTARGKGVAGENLQASSWIGCRSGRRLVTVACDCRARRWGWMPWPAREDDKAALRVLYERVRVHAAG